MSRVEIAKVRKHAWPPYYWLKDKKPGDMAGQGVGKVWYVVDPSTLAPKAPATPAATSSW